MSLEENPFSIGRHAPANAVRDEKGRYKKTTSVSRQEYYRMYREQNRERLLNYDRWRNHDDPERVEARKNYHQDYYAANKDKILERVRKYREKHPDQSAAFIKAWRDELFTIWGKLPVYQKQKLGFEAELIVEKILQEKGYETWKANRSFPVDILAKKDGKVYAVEVSIYPRKKFNESLRNLLAFLNIELICVFVRPNFAEYHLIHVPKSQKTISVPKKVVVNGGIKIAPRSR